MIFNKEIQRLEKEIKNTKMDSWIYFILLERKQTLEKASKITGEIIDKFEPKIRYWVAEQVFESMQNKRKEPITIEDILKKMREESKELKKALSEAEMK